MARVMECSTRMAARLCVNVNVHVLGQRLDADTLTEPELAVRRYAPSHRTMSLSRPSVFRCPILPRMPWVRYPGRGRVFQPATISK